MGGGCSYHWVYDGNEVTKKALKGNGDFRSDECVDILKQCDIVVTNPPFSLFREYVDLLVQYNKSFLVLGNQNAITYKNVFPHIKNEKIYLGYNNRVRAFIEPSGNVKKFGNICWYTTLTHDNPNKIKLRARYFDSTYKKYDNYDAINIDKVKDIPCDYYGVMGVPITYLYKHDPSMFEILGVTKLWANSINEIHCTKTYDEYTVYSIDGKCLNISSKYCNGKPILRGKGDKSEYHMNKHGDVVHQLYERIFIKRCNI